MSTSLIHDVSAQYMASLMFALTVLAAGGLRAAWRRRSQRHAHNASAASDGKTAKSSVPDVDPGGSASTHNPETSSEGRRQVSS
ncbi:hypothetical protein [Streptomyces sp. WG7]|uniref:hypothetical protein n=1 Tax=Streptomyces sp. WG7 TaxID=3417650 RepID=UPI003CEBA1F8